MLRNDRKMAARFEASRQVGVPVLVSALTIVEAAHGKTDLVCLKWVLSQLRVEPVNQEGSLSAVTLLRDAGGSMGTTTRSPHSRSVPQPRDRPDF
ncbi:hypothetical protein QFZ75_002877 [Streptomyces sp. V3I8]|nr:hypothetical protein [Streptomyces sp. V3I8]